MNKHQYYNDKFCKLSFLEFHGSLVFATETDKKGFDQEFVKQAVSGDKVEVRAIYGKKQNAQLTAKWIMLMNDIPHSF